jgi:hypothetical protein
LPLQNNATIINEVSQFCCSQLLKMLERWPAAASPTNSVTHIFRLHRSVEFIAVEPSRTWPTVAVRYQRTESIFGNSHKRWRAFTSCNTIEAKQ